MVKRRLGILMLLLCFCLCIMPFRALAALVSDAKEPISTDENCMLTVRYNYDGTAFPDQTVKLYKIADVSAHVQYTRTSAFAASGLILNGVQTNSDWNVIRSTLETFILANDVEPTLSTVTNQAGEACFENLTPGLYLVSAVDVVQGDLTCIFDSALVSLPGLGTDGLWQYQTAVSAKPEILPPIEPDEKVEFKVLKLWKGDEGLANRPQQIEVEIFRDGVHWETIVLSEETHWSYSWSVEADGASWNVVERNVPSGYTMTVEQRDTTFVLTNTHVPDDPIDPPPPQTGDTSNILLYTALMYVSGMVLIILGIAGKRRHHEETN